MFLMQMFYYRTQFTLDIFGVSLAINTIIVGCTEAIANILLGSILNQCRRKVALRLLIMGLMLLLVGLILMDDPVAQSVIEGVMRLLDTCIMLVLGCYLPELFTTN